MVYEKKVVSTPQRTDRRVIRRMKSVPGIPIHTLFVRGTDGPVLDAYYRSLLLSADLIMGRDATTKGEFVVYGRPALAEAQQSGLAEHHFRVAVVELDTETDELELLVSLVKAVRGRHDYLSWDEAPPELRLTTEEMERWGDLPGDGGGTGDQKPPEIRTGGVGAVVSEYRNRVIDDVTLGRMVAGLASIDIVGEQVTDMLRSILEHLDFLILGHLAEVNHPVFRKGESVN